MGSKTIALAGIGVSAALIYFCIDFKKDHIKVACNIDKEHVVSSENITAAKETTASKATEVEKTEKVIFEKSDPAFGIAMGDVPNIVGMFSPEEKRDRLATYIDDLCKEKECVTDIRYSDDIKSVTWDNTMIDMINFFREEHIQGASLYINSNVVHIEGEIATPEAKKRLEKLITKLSAEGLHVVNDTTDLTTESTDKIVEEIEKKIDKVQTLIEEEKKPQQTKIDVHEKVETEPISETPKPKEVQQVIEAKKAVETGSTETIITAVPETVKKVDKSDLQARIERVLQQEKIVFDDRMNRIADRSRKSMDELAALLQGRGPVHISVYAHASDDRMVNTIIAQKRAEIVKNYLRKKGVKVAVANGTGVAEGADRIEIKISE